MFQCKCGLVSEDGKAWTNLFKKSKTYTFKMCESCRLKESIELFNLIFLKKEGGEKDD